MLVTTAQLHKIVAHLHKASASSYACRDYRKNSTHAKQPGETRSDEAAWLDLCVPRKFSQSSAFEGWVSRSQPSEKWPRLHQLSQRGCMVSGDKPARIVSAGMSFLQCIVLNLTGSGSSHYFPNRLRRVVQPCSGDHVCVRHAAGLGWVLHDSSTPRWMSTEEPSFESLDAEAVASSIRIKCPRSAYIREFANIQRGSCC